MDIRTERFIEAFHASGLSQTELCEKTGLTKGAISSYLSGRYYPKQKTIELLANALNVSINYLMGYEENMDDNTSTFSIDEIMLIEKVRKLSPKARSVLYSIADTLLNGENDGNQNNK